MKSKAGLVLVVVLVLGMVASVVGAQGRGRDDGRRPLDTGMMSELAGVIAEETGLSLREFVTEVRESDATPADVIEANGGDVDTVVSEGVVLLTERINEAVANGTMSQERADEVLSNLKDNIRAVLNGERPAPQRLRDRLNGDAPLVDLMQELMDVTGRTVPEIAEQVREGATLNDVIEANGGNIDEVVISIETAITERINDAVENGRITQERADDLLDDLNERIRDFLSRDDLLSRDRMGRGVRLAQEVADAAGVELVEVREQIDNGATLADVLETNGVDVESFVEDHTATFAEQQQEQVDAGRITQEVADARVSLRQAELTMWLNRNPNE